MLSLTTTRNGSSTKDGVKKAKNIKKTLNVFFLQYDSKPKAKKKKNTFKIIKQIPRQSSKDLPPGCFQCMISGANYTSLDIPKKPLSIKRIDW